MSLVRMAFMMLSILAGGQAAAQNYPDRTIRIIVGFTPGSATDIPSRMFAQKLSEAWSVPVTVENIPGGGGSVGGRARQQGRAGRLYALLGRERRDDDQSVAAAEPCASIRSATSRRSRGCWSRRAFWRSTTGCRRKPSPS